MLHACCVVQVGLSHDAVIVRIVEPPEPLGQLTVTVHDAFFKGVTLWPAANVFRLTIFSSLVAANEAVAENATNAKTNKLFFITHYLTLSNGNTPVQFDCCIVGK